MNALLLYPTFPESFWSFQKTLELSSTKVLMPPLGLLTVAAVLPQSWNFKLVDRNVRPVTDNEWAWADLVLISGMIAQRDDLIAQVHEAKRRGKAVAVGGPYASSLADKVQAAGANFLVLDEGEVTIPLFLEALAQGRTQGVFRSIEKPDVTSSPTPRFDLLDLGAYDMMTVQYSRGCPFLCEFCDITTLYGRKPRTKTPEQVIKELDSLYQLGWRGFVFIVDDNFIGNKGEAKVMLRALKGWQVEHQYPFIFSTEASVDLAADSELMQLMVLCNFKRVFIGIETPDEESLISIRKSQNVRNPLQQAVDTISKAGLQIMAGFIIGFDGEKFGAGKRIVDFVENAAISVVCFNMLQVLPNTALWTRLAKEGRLVGKVGDMNQTTLTNFIPTRPIEEIADEYMEATWALYDPEKYLSRVYRQFMNLGSREQYPAAADLPKAPPVRTGKTLRALLTLLWRQGIKRATRRQFWRYLLSIARYKRTHLPQYLRTCAYGEHFIDYRETVRNQIGVQVDQYRGRTIAARRAA
jgi:radical SAM superfamily enzyme YgiQ (UPF0313 family)